MPQLASPAIRSDLPGLRAERGTAKSGPADGAEGLFAAMVEGASETADASGVAGTIIVPPVSATAAPPAVEATSIAPTTDATPRIVTPVPFDPAQLAALADAQLETPRTLPIEAAAKPASSGATADADPAMPDEMPTDVASIAPSTVTAPLAVAIPAPQMLVDAPASPDTPDSGAIAATPAVPGPVEIAAPRNEAGIESTGTPVASQPADDAATAAKSPAADDASPNSTGPDAPRAAENRGMDATASRLSDRARDQNDAGEKAAPTRPVDAGETARTREASALPANPATSRNRSARPAEILTAAPVAPGSRAAIRAGEAPSAIHSVAADDATPDAGGGEDVPATAAPAAAPFKAAADVSTPVVPGPAASAAPPPPPPTHVPAGLAASIQAAVANTPVADAPPVLNAAPVPMSSPDAPVGLPQLGVEITARLKAGKNRFEIRLDPPELGRINVRLEMDGAGNVTSRLIAEKQETLDLLRRDAPDLQRAFENAGLKTDSGGMQFSLQGQNGQDRAWSDHQAGDRVARLLMQDETALSEEAAPRRYYNPAGTTSGLDIRV